MNRQLSHSSRREDQLDNPVEHHQGHEAICRDQSSSSVAIQQQQCSSHQSQISSTELSSSLANVSTPSLLHAAHVPALPYGMELGLQQPDSGPPYYYQTRKDLSILRLHIKEFIILYSTSRICQNMTAPHRRAGSLLLPASPPPHHHHQQHRFYTGTTGQHPAPGSPGPLHPPPPANTPQLPISTCMNMHRLITINWHIFSPHHQRSSDSAHASLLYGNWSVPTSAYDAAASNPHAAAEVLAKEVFTIWTCTVGR